MATYKIQELQRDEDLLEMRPINKWFVNRYKQAYQSGADFPPLLIDKETKIIISGNHRHEAMRQAFGSEHDVEVIEQTFDSDYERLETFVRENVAHGMPLRGNSKRKLADALIQEGGTPKQVAKVFQVPPEKVQKWQEMYVVEVGTGTTSQETVHMKHGPEPPTREISAEQWQTHNKQDRGIKATELADQLTRWLDWGWVPHNADYEATLGTLHEALDRWLEQVKEPV